MSLILIQEVLSGLDYVNDGLGEAVSVLEVMLDDLSPDLEERYGDILRTNILSPLQSSAEFLSNLLPQLAEEDE